MGFSVANYKRVEKINNSCRMMTICGVNRKILFREEGKSARRPDGDKNIVNLM